MSQKKKKKRFSGGIRNRGPFTRVAVFYKSDIKRYHLTQACSGLKVTPPADPRTIFSKSPGSLILQTSLTLDPPYCLKNQAKLCRPAWPKWVLIFKWVFDENTSDLVATPDDPVLSNQISPFCAKDLIWLITEREGQRRIWKKNLNMKWGKKLKGEKKKRKKLQPPGELCKTKRNLACRMEIWNSMCLEGILNRYLWVTNPSNKSHR